MFKHTLALVGLSLITVSANAALYDRGNGLIYDDVLDITWLQDANYAYTSGYAAANAGGTDRDKIYPGGPMGWDAAKAWAAQLEYSGYDDWRLPSANLMNAANPCYATDGSCDMGYNNTTSDLGHIFYNNLANQFGYGSSLNKNFTDGNSGASVSFLNLHWIHWLGEEYAPGPHAAYTFHFSEGRQHAYEKQHGYYVWAVRDGDVSAVPVPAAAWLFGSALLGLVGVKRRRIHK